MTPETDNENKLSEEDGRLSSKNTDCGSDCSCQKPGQYSTSSKIIICLLVLIAVGSILFFKKTNIADVGPNPETSQFPNISEQANGHGSPNSVSQKAELGPTVASIDVLNTVGAKLDTTFLVIPAATTSKTSQETTEALLAVEKILQAKGIKSGIFVLDKTSSVYSDTAKMMKLPGVIVLTKGGTLGIVSGGITETNLMQAYVASTGKGGCGCGPKGCPTSAAPAPDKK